MQQDIFAAYPLTNNTLAKFKRDTFVFLSFQPCTFIGAKLPEAIVQMLWEVADNLERHHPDITILVIDIPALWTLGIDFAELMWMLYSLRGRYALILSTNKPHSVQKSSIRNLPFDKIVRVQRQDSDPEQVSIDLVTIRNDIDRKKDSCRLVMAVSDRQWKTRGAEKTSVVDKIAYIKQHRNKRIRDVAVALGISESYVKRLRSKAGVSKKVPGRAPKYPKRKALEYSF